MIHSVAARYEFAKRYYGAREVIVVFLRLFVLAAKSFVLLVNTLTVYVLREVPATMVHFKAIVSLLAVLAAPILANPLTERDGGGCVPDHVAQGLVPIFQYFFVDIDPVLANKTLFNRGFPSLL